MAKHTHHCDCCADLISVILVDCKADYISHSALAKILEATGPCYECQERLLAMQSRLTGRIYAQQLHEYFASIKDDCFNNVQDMFE